MSKVDWDDLGGVGSDASLKAKSDGENTTKSKTLTNLPTRFETEFKELKKQGKTGLTFNAYIIEALREKIERDQRN